MKRLFVTQGAALKSLFEVTKAAKLSTLSFTVHGQSLTVSAVDPAHVALFEGRFDVAEGPTEPTVICIDRDVFQGASKPFWSDKDVIVETNMGDAAGGQLKMTFKVGRRRRSVGCLDSRTIETPKVPQLTWPCEMQLPAPFLRSACKSAPKAAQKMTLSVSNNVFGVLIDTDGAADEFEDSIDVQGLEGVEERSMYSVDYMTDLLDPCISQQVVVRLGTNYPLAMLYAVAGGQVTALLAPRIQAGEEARHLKKDDEDDDEDPTTHAEPEE